MNNVSRLEIAKARRAMIGDNSMAALYSDLSRARGEFPAIPRTRKATVRTEKAQYSYMYADLADIFSAITEPMAAYGLGVWQNITPKGIVTIIYHESGATLSSDPWPIKPAKKGNLDDGQSLQAAAQMAKRYSLQAALGISTEESVEGDHSRRVDTSALGNGGASHATEGLRDAWMDGVLDSLPEGASDRDKASAFAEQLIKDFDTPKSAAGVNNAWNKRIRIIDALEAKHSDLYASVFDAFHARIASLEDTKEE